MSKELIEITSLLRMRFVTNDTCHKAADRIEELERNLLNLVCRIHRDGGHYIAKYGEAKAIADADIVAAQNNADLDTLQADNARLREALENCRLLAARHRKEEWAGHVLRLCESAGVAATALRSPK